MAKSPVKVTVNGIEIPNGTVSLPSLVFGSDLDSGITFSFTN